MGKKKNTLKILSDYICVNVSDLLMKPALNLLLSLLIFLFFLFYWVRACGHFSISASLLSVNLVLVFVVRIS